LIARWPGHIRPGGECSELITLIDMLATLAALTGQTLPADAAPDSFNVLPALLGRPHNRPARDTFIAQSGGTKGPFAIRQGQWKLIQAGGARASYGNANKTFLAAKSAKGKAPPFLVDLAGDLGESKNLAGEHPEKVQELQSLFEKQRDAGRSRP
jgi:arylsulfatase A-like enzyme